MKRGGPLGLQKGEEQELECKPPFVFLLFLFWLHATSKGMMSYKLVIKCCDCSVFLLQHHYVCAICK